jgi:hypothetical protein
VVLQSKATTTEYLGTGLTYGDFDNDGYDDFIVGGYYMSAGAGGVQFHSGPVSGTLDYSSPDATFKGSGFGYCTYRNSLTSARDVDGDGMSDFAVGCMYSSSYYGGAYYFKGPITGDLEPADAAADITGTSTYSYMGNAIAWAGDNDGDGYGDLLLTAYGDGTYGSYAGQVFLFLGPITGSLTKGDAAANMYGTSSSTYMGYSVAEGGDIDGDGYDDIAAGAYYAQTSGGQRTGADYVFFGPTYGPRSTKSADYQLNGRGNSDYAGWSTALLDFDGDGLMDPASASYYGTDSYGRVDVMFASSL